MLTELPTSQGGCRIGFTRCLGLRMSIKRTDPCGGTMASRVFRSALAPGA